MISFSKIDPPKVGHARGLLETTGEGTAGYLGRESSRRHPEGLKPNAPLRSFSFDDMEFAALFFSFAVLVGAPLMLITLMIGLLISFE